jgi:hypothetical protein
MEHHEAESANVILNNLSNPLSAGLKSTALTGGPYVVLKIPFASKVF